MLLDVQNAETKGGKVIGRGMSYEQKSAGAQAPLAYPKDDGGWTKGMASHRRGRKIIRESKDFINP